MGRRLAAMLATVAITMLAGAPGAVPAHAAATGGHVLWPGYSFYPRVIRLAHNGAANGTLVASVVTNDGNWVGKIMHSSDNGQTFTHVGRAYDPLSSTGMCCHTLYELPSPIGDMPAGTLLWAASFGADLQPSSARRMSERIWRSFDLGRTWSFLAEVDRSPDSRGTWEPEFTVAADGRLVIFYSDETDNAHSQKLVSHTSSDGVTWTAPSNVVALADPAARPGMAVVRRLPDLTYLMSYEVCGPGHNCEAYVRYSADGLNWGSPAAIGTAVRTADGRYPASTPTITISGNTVLLNSMRVRNANGTFAAGDGRMFFGNAAAGRGTWFEVNAPVHVSTPGEVRQGVPCSTWSNPLLGSVDGKSVLQIATDWNASGTCNAYVGMAASVPVGSRWAAEGGRAMAVPPYQEHFFARQPNSTLRHWFWDTRDGWHRDVWATDAAGQPAVFRYGTQQHAFWRNGSGALRHNFWDAATGASHADVWGSGLAGDPAALINGDAQHVWAVDTAGRLQHYWWAPGQPVRSNVWASGVTGKPSVMLVADAEHALVRTTSGSLRHMWWTAAQGLQAEVIGGGVAGDPVTAQIGDAYHAWAVDTAGNLRHWWWNPRQGWQSDTWGTGLTGRPAFLLNGAEQHVWVRTTTGALQHFWWAPGLPVQKNVWGGGIADSPTAAFMGTSMHVWALDSAGAAKHWWTVNNAVLSNDWGL